MKAIRIVFLAVLTVVLALPAFSASFEGAKDREGRQLRSGGRVKAPRNSTPTKPNGAQTKAAEGGWFICYSHPEVMHICDGSMTSEDCRNLCEFHCHGHCEWDASEM